MYVYDHRRDGFAYKPNGLGFEEEKLRGMNEPGLRERVGDVFKGMGQRGLWPRSPNY